MKYLLVLAVVLVAFFIWRGNRRERMRAPPPATPRPLDEPQSMTRCDQCGTHLPDTEAVPGRQGSYCSAAHRQLAEG